MPMTGEVEEEEDEVMAVLKTGWHDDPKVLAAGLDGMGLHAWSISYCDDQLTDGFVPHGALPNLPRRKQAIAAVVQAGLWHELPDGYLVNKYLSHNRSKEKVEAQRAQDLARKERHARNGSSRNPDGKSPDSEKIPAGFQAIPGPGPGRDDLNAAAAVGSLSRTPARDAPDTLPDAVRERLSRPPLTSSSSSSQ